MSMVPAVVARLPWRMLIPLVALVMVGTAVLYSAVGGSWQPYAAPHVIRFLVLLVLALGASRLPRDFFQFWAYPAYVVVLFLLLVVELVGAVGGGSQRWINLGPLVLQPSELMKPVIVLVLARFYSTLPFGMVPTWRSLVPVAALVGVPMALVMLQPDLGTALAIGFGGVLVMLLAGLPIRWFVGAGAAATVIAPLAFFFALHDYQRKRVLVFLDPESDPLGDGYHITQSKIAIGSGGFWGKGFGNGSQSHLDYLPEPHTDFAFATMFEEWGLAGGLVVLTLFALILSWGLRVAREAPDRFSKLLAAGMSGTIFFYIAINLMMVTGLAPVVGIPLPFISHGGSSMLTNMICIGTLMTIDRWNRKAPRGGLGS